MLFERITLLREERVHAVKPFSLVRFFFSEKRNEHNTKKFDLNPNNYVMKKIPAWVRNKILSSLFYILLPARQVYFYELK